MKKLLLLSAFLLIVFVTKSQTTDTSFVQVENARIHTVLSKPAKVPSPPLAIIIAGSGATDLNGNLPKLKNNSLQYLSDALVTNNIATLRFDKRGVAKSIYPGLSESDLSIDIYANDLTALIKYCKQKGFTNIYIIGHSQGSLIGLISAQNISISGFISLCGAGNSGDVLLKKQLQPKVPPTFYPQVESIIDSLKNGQTVKAVPPQLNVLFRPSLQPFLISWFKYNPAELIKNLPCQTLIVQGEKDIQMDFQEANLLKMAAPKSELVVVNQMNHILKTVEGDLQENMASYTNPDLPVNEELVKNIVEFIN
jgi:pimeloyl-ACP methyl ester carboxylesterase